MGQPDPLVSAFMERQKKMAGGTAGFTRSFFVHNADRNHQVVQALLHL